MLLDRFSPAFLALAVLAGGCAKKSTNLVVVAGQVTLDGKEPRNATVSFIPADETLEQVSTTVSPKGMYSLSNRDRAGIAPGRYKVVVETPDGGKYTTDVEVGATKRYDLQLTKD